MQKKKKITLQLATTRSPSPIASPFACDAMQAVVHLWDEGVGALCNELLEHLDRLFIGEFEAEVVLDDLHASIAIDLRDARVTHKLEEINDQARRLAQDVVRLAAIGLELVIVVALCAAHALYHLRTKLEGWWEGLWIYGGR